MTYQKRLGNQGEELAANFLKIRNYQIIERQWTCQYGEIDIIAEHQTQLVFIEVKTCKGNNIELAFTNLTPRKQQRFINAVQTYLTEHELDNKVWRIDAIGVAIPPHGDPIIEHVEDAFEW